MTIYHLPPMGTAQLPWGLAQIYDTGKRATPLQLAEAMGFQTALANASNHAARQRAQRELMAWTKALSDSVGLYNVEAKEVFFGMTDDGTIISDAPVVTDDRSYFQRTMGESPNEPTA